MLFHAHYGLPRATSKAFLAAVLLATLVYFALATQIQSVLFDSVGVATTAAMFLGIAKYRPQPRYAWTLLALGVLMMTGGDILYGVSQPVPSPADMLYVSAYPLIALGLIGLVRNVFPHRRDSTVHDVILVTAGIVIVGGVFLLVPEEDFDIATQAVALGYPVMDLTLIAILVRTRRVVHKLRVPFGFIGMGLLLMLAADTGFMLLDYGTSYAVGSLADAAWLIGYGCFGAALLHRAHGDRDRSIPPAPPVPTRSRDRLPGEFSDELAKLEAQVLEEITDPHTPVAAVATTDSRALRFRVVLAWAGWLLQGLALSAVLFAFISGVPNMVLLGGAYGGTGLLILFASRIAA